MGVQKTVCRGAKTLEHGAFQLRETVHACRARCRRPGGALVIRRACAPAEFLLPGRSVGYDVMVWLGRGRFLRNRQREELQAELEREYGIALSTGEISVLIRLFLDYVLRLHQARAAQIRRALEKDGGWPMNADATCEDGRGTLLAILAGWRGWVLGAWKIPTENTEAILDHMRSVVRSFGAPCAVMRDLGPAMILACEQLAAALGGKLPVLGCHSHFAADVGGDLLKEGHATLRNKFRNSKIRGALRAFARDLSRDLGVELGEARESFGAWQREASASHLLPEGQTGLAVVRGLAQWALDYPADAEYHRFPFDQPYLDLYDRCVHTRRAVDGFLRKPPEDRRVLRFLRRLGRLLDPVLQDPSFARTAEDLRVRADLFDELREALRLWPSTNGRNTHQQRLTPQQAAAELRDVRSTLKRFAASLRKRRPQRGPGQNLREAIDIILDHLKKHGKSLWGHAIRLPTEAGGGVRLVDRTNNVAENYFRRMKHGERRRSGRKNLAQDFEQLPPESALVRNFNDPDYVAIACGSLDRLPRVLAEMDAAQRRRQRAARPDTDPASDSTQMSMIETGSLPTIDRRLIRSEDMRRRLDVVVRSRPPHVPLSRPSMPIPTA